MRVSVWLVYKFPRIIVVCDFSPSSFKLRRGKMLATYLDKIRILT